MLSSLDPKQKEYVARMSVLQSAETSELSWDELDELSQKLNEAAKLGLEITGELSDFWSKFGSVAKEIATKFAGMGVKVAAKSLLPFLPL